MLNSILKLEGATVLSKDHQKSITGGEGTCAYILPNGAPVSGVSINEALAAIQGVSGAHWCCDSCGSASWLPGEGSGGPVINLDSDVRW